MRPHRQQPTRLPCPWDSPGKSTGVGCHLFFPFWLTSCWAVGSRFIHLMGTDSNVFLFYGWVIFHCIYVPNFFIPILIKAWTWIQAPAEKEWKWSTLLHPPGGRQRRKVLTPWVLWSFLSSLPALKAVSVFCGALQGPFCRTPDEPWCVLPPRKHQISCPSSRRKWKVLIAQSCSTLCNPMNPLWNSPGKTARVGSHSLLQGIFLTQGLNQGLLHSRQILFHLSYQGSS